MKLNHLIFGTMGFALLFGSAGYFHGQQIKTNSVSSFQTTRVMPSDVFDSKDMFDFKTVEMTDVIKMAEAILFEKPKFDVNFVISDRKMNRIYEVISVSEINNKHLNNLNFDIKNMKEEVEFLKKIEFSTQVILSKMDKTPPPVLALKTCEKSIKKAEPKKMKTVCPHKKPSKNDRLRRFKKSASWI